MRSKLLVTSFTLLLAAALFAGPLPQTSASGQSSSAKENANANSDEGKISQEVRHQLFLLPWYTVFDVLEYSVNDGTVTLRGYVTRSSLKSDAEKAAQGVDGVHKVINQIQVLPPSSMDDQIRRAEYRSIYEFDPLLKYAYGPTPQIHIIVDNGRVQLYGKVESQADKQMILQRAKMVPNTFNVEDHLQVMNQGEK